MSEKSGNEIHKAYMKGYYEGQKDVLVELAMLMDTLRDERKKKMEIQE